MCVLRRIEIYCKWLFNANIVIDCYMANCEQCAFPYPNFRVCLGILVVVLVSSVAAAAATVFAIEVNHSTI